MKPTPKLDLDDIQGIVLHGYGSLPFVRYLFLRFDDPGKARAWLTRFTGEVTSSRARGTGAPRLPQSLHVAFTSHGLHALGFAEADMDTFPTTFHLGMTDPFSSRILGDIDENEPKRWQFGYQQVRAIHALVILYADTEERIKALESAQRERMTAFGVGVERVEEGYRAPDGKEHFGFVDGLSQPVVAGSEQPGSYEKDAIAAGEFVLGYENEYSEMPSSPSVPSELDPDGYLPTQSFNSARRDLGRNGTFLVFRKLAQDAAGFWRFAREQSKTADGIDDDAAATRLAACVVGRWPSGAPLVLSPERDDASLSTANAFTYRGMDPKGAKCPIGAHIRRANPRDGLPPDSTESLREARRHRLLRRGRIYGPRLADPSSTEHEEVERGFQFIAINADIHRQFEFVQQTWINSPKFGDLYEDPDPLVGVHPRRGDRTLTIQGEPVRRRLVGLPSFVRVMGGGYFFVPSLRGLRFIAQGGYAQVTGVLAAE